MVDKPEFSLSPTGETTTALAECEAIIQDGMETFLAVGNALVRIRDAQLYTEVGYTSFDQYCRERWGMSGSHAYRLIDASEVVRELPPGTPPPVNEAQARELKSIAPEDRAEVMEEAARQTGGKPTAAAVKHAAARRRVPKQDDQDRVLAAARVLADEGRVEFGAHMLASRASEGRPAAMSVQTAQAAADALCKQSQDGSSTPRLLGRTKSGERLYRLPRAQDESWRSGLSDAQLTVLCVIGWRQERGEQGTVCEGAPGTFRALANKGMITSDVRTQYGTHSLTDAGRKVFAGAPAAFVTEAMGGPDAMATVASYLATAAVADKAAEQAQEHAETGVVESADVLEAPQDAPQDPPEPAEEEDPNREATDDELKEAFAAGLADSQQPDTPEQADEVQTSAEDTTLAVRLWKAIDFGTLPYGTIDAVTDDPSLPTEHIDNIMRLLSEQIDARERLYNALLGVKKAREGPMTRQQPRRQSRAQRRRT